MTFPAPEHERPPHRVNLQHPPQWHRTRVTSSVALLLAASLSAFGVTSIVSRTAAAQTEESKNAAMGALALAKHHYQNKKYKDAAKLFHQAYGLNPLPGFLFNAARAEQRAFQLDLAEAHYKQVLKLKELDEKTRGRAKFHLGEVSEIRKRLADERQKAAIEVERQRKASSARRQREAVEKERANAAAAASAKQSSGSWRAPAGLATFGVGAVLAGVGGYLSYEAANRATDLQGRLDQRDGSGLIVALSHAEYSAEKAEIDSQSGTSVALIGGGAAAVGVGAWLWLTRSKSPSQAAQVQAAQVQVLPGVRSLALSLRF